MPPLIKDDVIINIITRFLRIKDIVLNYPLADVNAAVAKLATAIGRKADSEYRPIDYVLLALQGPNYLAFDPNQDFHRVFAIDQALRLLELVAGVIKTKAAGDVGANNYLGIRTPHLTDKELARYYA